MKFIYIWDNTFHLHIYEIEQILTLTLFKLTQCFACKKQIESVICVHYFIEIWGIMILKWNDIYL